MVNSSQNLTYDLENRLKRARDRAITVDKVMGLRGKKVLEIGCGDGDFCKILAEEYDCEVVGTEILEYEGWKSVKHENLKLLQVDISNGNFFPENYFDRIVSFVVWEHMRHPWSALQECSRILKPTGKKYLHAYLYGWPRLSHLYAELNEPWLHLTHSANELMKRLGKETLPWYYFCNRLSYLHYLQYFRKLGFYIEYENIIQDPFPQEFYDANEKILGLYPKQDLKMHGFQVVLIFDDKFPKQIIPDPIYSRYK